MKSQLEPAVTDLGETKLKNIAESIRTYSLQVGAPAEPKTRRGEGKTRAVFDDNRGGARHRPSWRHA